MSALPINTGPGALSPFLQKILLSGGGTPPLFPGMLPGAPVPGMPAAKGIAGPVAGTAPKTGLAGFSQRLGETLGSPTTQFALNMLANSGPSLVPRSFGQIVGQSGLQAFEAQQAAGLADARKRLIESQIGLNKAGGSGRRNVQSQFVTRDGKLGFLRRDGSIEITDVDLKKNYTIRKLPDGSEIAISNTDPGDMVPVVSEDEARDAQVRASETKKQAEAATNLPTEVGKAERALDVLSQIEKHPGFSGAVGMKGPSHLFGITPEPIPGTQEADFVALVNQIGGQAFLTAFQDLKGGGHITEIEGLKAEQAIARIRDRNQSEKGYRKAIQDLRDVINSGLERQRKAAEGDFTPSETKGSDAQSRIDAL
jgi:hypothetical protein